MSAEVRSAGDGWRDLNMDGECVVRTRLNIEQGLPGVRSWMIISEVRLGRNILGGAEDVVPGSGQSSFAPPSQSSESIPKSVPRMAKSAPLLKGGMGRVGGYELGEILFRGGPMVQMYFHCPFVWRFSKMHM